MTEDLGLVLPSSVCFYLFCSQHSAINWVITINMYTRPCKLNLEQLLLFSKNWYIKITFIFFSLLLRIWLLLLLCSSKILKACSQKLTSMENRDMCKNRSENIYFSWCRESACKHYTTQCSEKKSWMMLVYLDEDLCTVGLP